MKRFFFVADVHVGNHTLQGGASVCGINDRCQDHLRALAQAVELAKAENATLVICGDLFDVAKPTPQVVAAVMNVLARGGDIIVLVGNHDRVTDASGDHACAPLTFLGNVSVVDEPTKRSVGGVNIAFLPPPPRGTKMKDWATANSDILYKTHIIVAHCGIITEKTPPFLTGSEGALTIAQANTLLSKCLPGARMYVGDWHTRMTSGAVEQIGALCPTGWDNATEYEGHTYYGWISCAEVDPKSDKVTRLTPQRVEDIPTFLVADSVEQALELSQETARARVKLKVHPREIGKIDKGSLPGNVLVVAHKERADEIAKADDVKTRASSVVSIEEAIWAHAETVAPEDEVNGVAQLALSYYRGAE